MGRWLVVRPDEGQEVQRRTYGSPHMLDKYARREKPSELVVDPDVTHTTIDSLPEVQELVRARVHEYVRVLLEAR
jgi:hypothetical protein